MPISSFESKMIDIDISFRYLNRLKYTLNLKLLLNEDYVNLYPSRSRSSLRSNRVNWLSNLMNNRSWLPSPVESNLLLSGLHDWRKQIYVCNM